MQEKERSKMNDHDITAAADEVAYQCEEIAKGKSGSPKVWDFISGGWSHCAGWFAECRPEVVEILRQGRVREALGIAFTEGQRLGELNAFMDPARHSVMSEVDGRMAGTVASPDLVKSRKRHRDHRTANQMVTSEFQEAVKRAPRGTIEDWTASLPSKGEMVLKLWKEHGVPRKIAEGALPDWWPKGRRGPKPKKPSTLG
jgi:hypothetical protein